MFDIIAGQYIANVFGGKTVNITFEQTLLPFAEGTLSMADAEDSATLTAKIGSGGDIYLLDCFSYADPGFVQINLLPDGESARKTKIDAHKNATRIPFPVPVLVAVDVNLDYINQGVANNIYVNLTGVSFTQDNSLKFQDWCTSFIDALMIGGQQQVIAPGAPGYTPPTGSSAKLRCKRTRA